MWSSMPGDPGLEWPRLTRPHRSAPGLFGTDLECIIHGATCRPNKDHLVADEKAKKPLQNYKIRIDLVSTFSLSLTKSVTNFRH
jgi:hypothetical protein